MEIDSSVKSYTSNQSLSLNISCDDFHIASAEISKISNENSFE
jgi:hypothetical protein